MNLISKAIEFSSAKWAPPLEELARQMLQRDPALRVGADDALVQLEAVVLL